MEESARKHCDAVADSFYDLSVDWLYEAMRVDEHAIREAKFKNLDISPDSRILEVGCGTGRDTHRIANKLSEKGSLHIQDLSPNMVKKCHQEMQKYAERHNIRCELVYFVSNATYLPYPDNFFDLVFHVGAFNVFEEQEKTLQEFCRITKPGGKIAFGDESVAPWLRGSEYANILIANNPMFQYPVPLDKLPESARNVTCEWIIGNSFYFIVFEKGEGFPDIDLDLEHQGRRGGSMRSRYYGQLEGVSVETKQLAWDAVNKTNSSMYKWLDEVVRTAAENLLNEGDRKEE